MDGPPPPPPPHGENPRTQPGGTGESGGYRRATDLPEGNYDIFVIPPHSAGSGFLYLPSLQCHRNSFLAGMVSTLLGVLFYFHVVPILKTWTATVVASGGMGVFMLVIGIGIVSWAIGRTQAEGGGFTPRNGSKPDAPGSGPRPREPPPSSPPPGGPGGPSGQHNQPRGGPQYQNYGGQYPGAGYGGSHYPGGQYPGGQYPGSHQYNHTHPPPPHSPKPDFTNEQPPKPSEYPREEPKPAPEEEPKPTPKEPKSTPKEDPKPEPPKPDPPKEEPPKPEPPKEDPKKRDWEKAREETRRREELKRRMDEIKKKREEAERIRKEEEERKAKEEKDKRDKETREREYREWKEKRAKERLAKEAAEKEAAEKLAKEKLRQEAAVRYAAAKEAAAAKRAAAAAESVSSKAPNPQPKSQPPSPEKNLKPAQMRPPAPSRTEVEDDTYSFRPYDRPKSKIGKPGTTPSVFSESTYAPSRSTANTTPPPSRRGPYTTKDPDKVIIHGVYSFNNAFMRTPIAQLSSGKGAVTDGLVLRITTEGMFVDDDVRGVAQREWDIKAWTMKLVEVWCPLNTTNNIPSVRSSTAKLNPFRVGSSQASSSKVPSTEESEACLAGLLKICKNQCRLGACATRNSSGSVFNSGSHNVDGRFPSKQTTESQGLHVVRASLRDQEGKKFVFVLDETEAWKVAVGLQRLRKGSQVRALGVCGLPSNEAAAILANLGF
ncbi:hypothetical protein FQN57_007157 [Myotisia sp. PD_48]|nr:hypothetical protein FQN57_007157 [Myotisia sp. PD_48]